MGLDWQQETSDWLVQESLKGTYADALIQGLCERMIGKGGVPLVRVHVACGYLHPLFQSLVLSWSRDEGLRRDRFSYAGNTTQAWQESPLRAVLSEQRPSIRARLEKGEGVEEFPVLKEFQERGFTDYYVVRQAFRVPVADALNEMDGCILSFSSDQPGGFSDDCIRAINRLFPRFSMAMKTLMREITAQNVASTYLGNQAGELVLRGRIRRGDADEIQAAVWFSDMRNSTASADKMDPRLFLDRMNRYFECTAGAVLDHGGEVLRFIGDAVLAIFPINGPGGAERAGRMAISATRDAVRRLEKINTNPPADDPDPIEFGLGLHVGTVLYGNIGVAERLEFSVIGPTANEAARLEDLSKSLKRTVIASSAFAITVNAQWEAMGTHRLRGVSDPQLVYALKL